MATLTLIENGREWGALYLDGELLEQHRTCDQPETIATLCIENDVHKFENRMVEGRFSKLPDTLEKIRQSEDLYLK